MHILAVMITMRDALNGQTVPHHHVAGLHEWSQQVARAVAAGTMCGSSSGMNAEPAWSAQITHRAFMETSHGILEALKTQQRTAALLHQRATTQAAAEKSARRRQAARGRARLAETWRSAAAAAEQTGRTFITDIDGRYRPIGQAIAAAGGLAEVAQDKTYHQMGRD